MELLSFPNQMSAREAEHGGEEKKKLYMYIFNFYLWQT